MLLYDSLRVSTHIWLQVGASAMAPYGVIVYVPDQRLGNGNRKLGTDITPKSLR